MDTEWVVKPPAERRRRRHTEAFKAQVIEACLQPGVSVAAVALANQLNANMLRIWVKAYRSRRQDDMSEATHDRSELATTTLVPVQVEAPASQGGGEIRIEVRQSQRVVQVSWPTSETNQCVRWLKELLG